MLGSYVGYTVSHGFLAYISLIGMILMGVKFLAKPVKEENTPLPFVNSRRREILCHLLTGVVIGSICGFCGVGGGMMMLLIFTMLLGYDMKTAVDVKAIRILLTQKVIIEPMDTISTEGMPMARICSRLSRWGRSSRICRCTS